MLGKYNTFRENNELSLSVFSKFFELFILKMTSVEVLNFERSNFNRKSLNHNNLDLLLTKF
jgi:hypothetical protein